MPIDIPVGILMGTCLLNYVPLEFELAHHPHPQVMIALIALLIIALIALISLIIILLFTLTSLIIA